MFAFRILQKGSYAIASRGHAILENGDSEGAFSSPLPERLLVDNPTTFSPRGQHPLKTLVARGMFYDSV